jgi:hypothetical protein
MLKLICADVGPSGAKPSDPFGDRSSTGLSAFGEPDTGEKHLSPTIQHVHVTLIVLTHAAVHVKLMS